MAISKRRGYQQNRKGLLNNYTRICLFFVLFNYFYQVLEDKQQGILHIASTLKSDTKELEEIVEAIKKR